METKRILAIYPRDGVNVIGVLHFSILVIKVKFLTNHPKSRSNILCQAPLFIYATDKMKTDHQK